MSTVSRRTCRTQMFSNANRPERIPAGNPPMDTSTLPSYRGERRPSERGRLLRASTDGVCHRARVACGPTPGLPDPLAFLSRGQKLTHPLPLDKASISLESGIGVPIPGWHEERDVSWRQGLGLAHSPPPGGAGHSLLPPPALQS